MADPVYRIFYGQYPDVCTTEIPNTHIREVDTLSFRIEPGKPAEPVTDDVSFTLENLAHDGSQRYPTSWFDAQSRTEEDGATYPNQLFFKIENTTHGISYVGMYNGKKNGAWDETVTVKLKSLLSFIIDSNAVLLKDLNFSDSKLILKKELFGSPDYKDLMGNTIKREELYFVSTEKIITSEPGEIDDTHINDVRNYINQLELLQHLGLTFDDLSLKDYVIDNVTGTTEIHQESFYCWVEINGIKLLTGCVYQIEKYSKDMDTDFGEYHYESKIVEVLIFDHSNNDKIETDNIIVLPRGRFYASPGEELNENNTYNITLWLPSLNNNEGVVISDTQLNLDIPKPWRLIYGIRLGVSTNLNEILPSEIDIDYFDALQKIVEVLNSFFDFLNESNESNSFFDITLAGNSSRYIFLADIGMIGWLSGKSIGDIIVDLAMQTNSYLFVNEQGKIVFQDRLLHQSHLPGSLPPDTLYIAPEDIEPLGGEDDTNGFDSYKIEFEDRVEINNIASDNSFTSFVDKDGTLSKPKLRNSSIEVNNYRTSDLGIPGSNDHPDLPVFRYSPDHPSFPGSETLADFIPDPVTQAQNFAKSFSYPTILWNIRVSMAYYTTAKIGRYFWTVKDGQNKCYLIKQIHFDQDGFMIKIQAQYVGVYTGS